MRGFPQMIGENVQISLSKVSLFILKMKRIQKEYKVVEDCGVLPR